EMIEVQVGEQHVHPPHALVGHRDTKRAHAGAGVEHDRFAISTAHLDARSVAAVADGVGAGCGERAAAAPDPHLHDAASQNTVSTPCMSSVRPNNGYAVTSN